jgi:hypothetical protein
MSPAGTSFKAAKKRPTPWYLSRPRLLATLCLFAVLYLYFNHGSTPVVIPADSYELLKDESLSDILNSTLGVCVDRMFLNSSLRVHVFSVLRYHPLSTVVSILHNLNGHPKTFARFSNST